MTSIALLFIGFSVISSVLLALTHFRERSYAGLGTAQLCASSCANMMIW